MKDIPLKAKVECTDGHGGESVCVVVDRTTLKVTHFVVKEKHRPHTQRMVPVEKVEETTPKTITLACSQAEMAEMDEFLVKKYHQVEIPRYSTDQYALAKPIYSPQYEVFSREIEQVPEGEGALHKGAGVEAIDGKVGQVDELLVDESGQITHLVLREGHLWRKKEIVIPVSVVDKVLPDPDTVYLTLDKATISAMLDIQ